MTTTVNCEKRFNPATFIFSTAFTCREDSSVTALKNIDVSRIVITVCQKDLEGKIPLGADHFLYFWENQDNIPEEWKEAGTVRFSGTVLGVPWAGLCVLCLKWDNDDGWSCYLGWIPYDQDTESLFVAAY